jgi:hypothetical protein
MASMMFWEMTSPMPVPSTFPPSFPSRSKVLKTRFRLLCGIPVPVSVTLMRIVL